MNNNTWQFWVDRGGTFTDVVAKRPDGSLLTHKLLSENPEHYEDASVQGIRDVLGDVLGDTRGDVAGETSGSGPPEQRLDAPVASELIEAVKMGTTVATNALLERKGEPTVLVITRGFADMLRIGYQARPALFERHIVLPELLYTHVIEADERHGVDGEVLQPLDESSLLDALVSAFEAGFRCAAVVFLHGYRFPEHEVAACRLAREAGFSQVSASHTTSPLIKLVGRGDTTVVDAYLSPILGRYVDRIAVELGEVRLQFMQSNGGLTDARRFHGKDSILSGPAGGIVGAVRVAENAGLDRIITFDMGGTSTDVAHYSGELERAFETLVAGVRMRAPMMQIHTVAAGGGSICSFDGSRYRVGPRSAAANPGPAAYRRGGPLTVTDCNVMLGKLQPEFFPAVFGPGGDEPLDPDAVSRAFDILASEIRQATGDARAAMEVAEGFLKIAVENMANAIKKISVQRGYDVTEYALVTFGGAGGQHACLVADALGMTTVLIHPFAGVLSAYGMGLADVRTIREVTVEAALAPEGHEDFARVLDGLAREARAELSRQGVEDARIEVVKKLHVRYDGSDTSLEVDFGDHAFIVGAFEQGYRSRFGFLMEGKGMTVATAAAEAIGRADAGLPPPVPKIMEMPAPLATVQAHMAGAHRSTPVYDRGALPADAQIAGPAIIKEETATTIVEPGWQASMQSAGELLLTRVVPLQRQVAIGTECDPVMLEVFNNLFMSIAEQMGYTLQNTAYSVNIKERLDFSCAIFDADGNLIANAPHMPVHLGSMSESVRTVIHANAGAIQPGDVFAINAPYNGGTHLPDVTVITPVFDDQGARILFYTGSRGHHADIGGRTPGSMPADSVHIDEEGVLFDNFKLVDRGRFCEQQCLELLASGAYPARNPQYNMADLRAQIAANEKGARELHKMVDHFGLATVHAYMGHVQDNAEECVRRVLDVLSDGEFRYELDDGSHVQVSIDIDKAARNAVVDFAGTSVQQSSNFNAPSAVCRAAVMYVFRTLVDDEIPMNEGVLNALDIRVPEGSMLSPNYPAAVVAGNVETSQVITDTLYGALGVLAASQGTMNNVTFGNERHQYYETICGGSGAGPDFDGTDAVHTHMTNSRLTDPEVLELRYPVRLERFEIRRGSGGAGRHCGGNGVRRQIRFLENMEFNILSNHRRVAPYGVAGGEPGALGRTRVEHVNGEVTHLKGADGCPVQAMDMLVVETPGGGGYGEPE